MSSSFPLATFRIKRSLNSKGYPYDNAVAEATFTIFKTEFANQAHFLTGDRLFIKTKENRRLSNVELDRTTTK